MSVDFEPVDLDAADWSFADLRSRPVAPELYDAAWQEQRRAAMREREAARTVAREEAVERNLAETRRRVAERQAAPPKAGVKPARRPVQQQQKASRVEAPGVADQPVPPQGTLLRYARVGASVVAVSVTPAIFGCCRYSVWLWRGGVWALCGVRYDRTGAFARAERLAVALQQIET